MRKSKNKAPHPVPLRWRGAAQRRGGQRIQESATSLFALVITMHHNKKSPPKQAIFYFIIFLSHHMAIAGTKNKTTPVNPHTANVPIADK